MARKKPKPRKKKKGRRPSTGTSSAPPLKKGVRRRWLVFFLLLGGAVALYAFDRSGPIETIKAEVVDARTYPHRERGSEAHSHTEATLEFEGTSKTLKKADSLSRGDWVEIDVRRGRISGWAHFAALRGSADIDLLDSGEATPQPWQYDIVSDRHWDPNHNHWHDGPPPQR